jgi:hypothetical protein
MQVGYWYTELRETGMNRDSGVMGYYWTDPDGTPRARIVGELNYLHLKIILAGNALPVLWGSFGGSVVTLIEPKLAQPLDVFRSPRVIELEGRLAMHSREGVIFETSDLVDKFRISLWDLSSWAAWNSYDYALAPDVVFQLQPSRNIVFRAPMGANITLRDRGGFESRSYEGWTLTSDCQLEVTIDGGVTLTELVDLWLEPLEHFIISATGRSTGFRSLQVSNDDLRRLPDKTEAQYSERDFRWWQVKFRQSAQPSKEPPNLLHSLSDFAPDYDLSRLFDAASRYRYAIDQASSVKAGLGGTGVSSYIALMQALESLDSTRYGEHRHSNQRDLRKAVGDALRKAGIDKNVREAAKYGVWVMHRPQLSKRLQRLDDEANHILGDLVSDPRWPDVLAGVRNAIAHGLGEAGVLLEYASALTAGRLMLMTLWDVHWLMLLGFPADKAVQMRRSTLRWASIEQTMKDHYGLLQELVNHRATVPEDGPSIVAATNE